MVAERVRLRIGNLAKAVLVTGQAYQDPKDALNEFVSNAADEYAEAGIAGGRIRVVLRRRGRHPLIAVADDGRGMDAERLRQAARNLFESAKAGDERTLGEKAIGILAFQQLGERCDIVSRPQGDDRTALRLVRGQVTASLELNERRRARQLPGTTIYLSGLDPEALRVLTPRKVVDYLRRRRGAALLRGEYSIEVIEGRSGELVTAEVPDGIRLPLPAQPTLWGRIEFVLFVAPKDDRRRRVAVVGRAGTTIIDDLCELEEFDASPWSSDQVSGQVVFESLQQSAGRRAILRDREAFPVFVTALSSVERAGSAALERIGKELDERTARNVTEAVRRIFERVLRELADLDNPMRTPVGSEEGEGALLAGGGEAVPPPREPPDPGDASERNGDEPPLLPVLEAPDLSLRSPSARPERSRSTHLPDLAPDPNPGEARSRFDPEGALVYYNDTHPDYLFVKDEEAALLDYLATLVAKEYVVYNNPRSGSADLGEEMVRMLVRVRRHLPRRR